MYPKYVDIHAHLQFAAFDADRAETLTRAREAGVWMINVGTQIDTSKKAVELAEAAGGGVFAAVGLHPIHSSKSFHDEKELGEGGAEFTSRGEKFDSGAYRPLAERRSVVAIGECGLDYFRLESDTKSKQKDIFEQQIALANTVGKPLMCHVREAYADALDILKKNAKVKGNMHFFAGSWDEAKKFLDIGFTLSFTGVLTFARNYDEVVKNAPLGSMMAETDCPYVTPAPFRGKRNEPTYVAEVYKAIARIRGEDEQAVRAKIVENSLQFFGLGNS